MGRTRKVKCCVTILNKFGATHPSITGRSAGELADFLYAQNIDVRIISIKAAYKGKCADTDRALPFQAVELKGLYNGCNKYARLLTNLIDGFRLVLASLSGRRDDAKIVMTDPSLINIWAVLFRPFYRSKLIFWTMDLYPDAFRAAGLVSQSNLLYRMLSSIVYHLPPDYLIALGTQQYNYLSEKYGKEIPCALLPCGINRIETPKDLPWWKQKYQDKIILCYAGNLGEAHDACFLQELIDQLDPERYVMLLALYGAKAVGILQSANQHSGIVLLDYISPEQLAFVDVNIASLLPDWNHVCVPSKVVSAICAGSPVLYNASNMSEGYCMFKDAVWLMPKDADYFVRVAEFYNKLNKASIGQKKKNASAYACQLQDMRKKAFEDILEYCLYDV